MDLTGISTRIAAAVLCGAALAGAPATATATPDRDRGAVVSVTPVVTMDAGQVTDYLTKYGLDPASVRYGVDARRVVYRTIDPRGRATTASALVVLPRSRDRTPRQVTWLHGTTAYRGSVASVSDGGDRAAALLFASAGYLTSAPDYLGLGVGPGTHPYVHVPSTVTASLDALRATRQLAGRAGLRPDPRVSVTGHSQGGHAAMALGRALQDGADHRLRLGGLAPIAGPHQPSAAVADALSGKIENGVAYLAYWTVAWDRLFNLYDSPADAFKDPTVESLFDGEHRNEDIFPLLPATVPELFRPEFLDKLEHPTGALRSALKEADSFCDWRPRVPVRLYASSGDRDVPFALSVYCQRRLAAHHTPAVTLVDLGADVDHGEAADLALPRILAEFDRS
jgi:acetyl esterase/lipase